MLAVAVMLTCPSTHQVDQILDFQNYLFIHQYVNRSAVGFIDKCAHACTLCLPHTRARTHTEPKCWVWAVFDTNEANQNGAHSNRAVIGCAELLRSSRSWDADEEPMGIEQTVFLL